MIQLDINLPGRSYPILIGENVLQEQAGLLASYCPGGTVAVVSDEKVWSLHGPDLEKILKGLGLAYTAAIIPQGETSKSLAMLEKLYKEFFRYGLKRNHAVIAFGGGVAGDLAGFAASTYMRGLPFIQIPTTLLAQVDSSVGGKVAVNLEEGKNLVGSFYQPNLVLADTGLLASLPRREWLSGLAEVVKYAAIGAGSLPSLLAGPEAIRQNLEQIVYLCCKQKAAYVEKDERDTGERMFLNFGHTFGHAIEKYHDYQKYNHGEAVAIGMALAARTGQLLGLSEKGTAKTLMETMDKAGLTYTLTDKLSHIIPLMTGDKKNQSSEITLVLLKKLGSPILHAISQTELMHLLKEAAPDHAK